MVLRIRKEVQEELKASLDAAPSAMPAAAEAPEAPQTHQQPKAGTAKPSRKDRARAGPRVKAASRPPRKTTSKTKGAAQLPAPYRPSFKAELREVKETFAFLRARTQEPEQLEALERVTLQYLRREPSTRKFQQVQKLLERQVVEMMVRDFEAHQRRATVIEMSAAAPAPAVAHSTPDTASAKLSPDVAPDRRRRLLPAWLARRGGGGEGGGRRIPLPRFRTAAMAAIWLAVGGATITYASALYYVNYMRLETDTAMIAGVVEPVNAPMDGSITSLLVRPGDRIAEGTRVMVLEDPEVEKMVRLASVKVERAREELRLKQAELESERLKRDEYVQIARSKIEKIDEDLQQLVAQERVARERFDRLADLFKKGIVIRPRLEEASDKLAELTAQLSKARINRRERQDMQDNVLAGHFFDGSQVVGRLKEAEAAMQRASAEVDLALEELQVMQQRRHITRITAARDSRVMKVLRPEGAAVKKGDTILVLEAIDSRVVHAFIRQEEASRIALGDEATVFLPALRAKTTARVTAVERNAAFIDDMDARYTWKQARDGGPKPTDRDRTARVTLRFDTTDRDVVDNRLEIGMPTIVSFPRRSINTVFSSFAEVGRER